MTLTVAQQLEQVRKMQQERRRVLPNLPLKGRPVVPQPELPFPGEPPLPASFDASLRGMRDAAFLKGRKWQEQQWRAKRDGVHPDLLRFETLLIRRMARLDVPMYCAEAIRSEERQADLYAHGFTKIKAVGAHTRGCAMDIVHSVNGWTLSRKQWALIGHVGIEVANAAGLKVEWGGNWSFYDPAHWEMRDWRTVAGGFPFKKED